MLLLMPTENDHSLTTLGVTVEPDIVDGDLSNTVCRLFIYSAAFDRQQYAALTLLSLPCTLQ